MSNTATYPLRMPKSLKEGIARLAKREHTSINQLINIAVAEKLSAIETSRYFTEKSRDVDLTKLKQLLFREGG